MGRPQPRAPTRIIDVAKLAGVSPQTVSNVVNNRGGFTESTRHKVVLAIEETGYRPNRAARQLRTRNSMNIGFAMPLQDLDPRHPFAITFLQTVIETAQSSGNSVVMFTHGPDDVETVEGWAKSGEVDGFILCNVTPGDFRTRVFTAFGIPFAVLGRTSLGEPQSWVDMDNRAAMSDVVDHLVAKGHRTFAYLGYRGTQHWMVERLEGTRDRLAEHGIHLAEQATLRCDYADVVSCLDTLLHSGERPSALITASDSLALLATTRARAHGLVVGTDLAITGFYAGPLEWLVDPPLTTVRPPMRRLARAVVSRLLLEMQGPSGLPGEYVPTELSIGESA